MRACKNCKRYFAITGRISAEYCDRPINNKERTYKDLHAINLWNEKMKNCELFKVYRREYKKRFGCIKAGKIEQDVFYAWSEKAREQKAKCNSDEISLREFSEWLKKFMIFYFTQVKCYGILLHRKNLYSPVNLKYEQDE